MAERPFASGSVSGSPVGAGAGGAAGGAGAGAAPAAAVARTQIWVSEHGRPTELDPRLILLREPDSERAASFRLLRYRLAERGNPRAIVVTSAEPRSGKTTCAVNLA